MKFLIPALVLSVCIPAAFSQEQIIPKPAEITLLEGPPAQLTPASAIVPMTQDKPFLDRAGQFQQMLSQGAGLPLSLKTAQEAPKNAACIIIKKDPSLAARGGRKPIPSSPPPGKYTVTLLYEIGANAVEIESVGLYEGDKEIARDAHPGKSGARKENIRYTLNVPAAKEGAGYTVKARLKGSQENGSYGTVYGETP